MVVIRKINALKNCVGFEKNIVPASDLRILFKFERVRYTYR